MGRPLVIGVAEVAELVSCSIPTVHRMVAARELPGPINPDASSRRKRWSVAELERWADPSASAADASSVPVLRVVGS